MDNPPVPLALIRGAATALPRPLLAALAAAVVRGLNRTHPKLIQDLGALEPAVVHVLAHDLPYRFAITLGRGAVALKVVDRDCTGADAEVAASVATLVDLVEGRIDGDTLFFRRDLRISGDTSVIVGLRNVLDREELSIAAELEALCGPLGKPARRVARALDRVLGSGGARLAAMHRTLHPPGEDARDVAADLARCHEEIAALTGRLGALEARLKRRADQVA